MKPLKKIVSNAKGAKATNINSKLSEDMVIFISFRKTKSKTHLLFMILPTLDI